MIRFLDRTKCKSYWRIHYTARERKWCVLSVKYGLSDIPLMFWSVPHLQFWYFFDRLSANYRCAWRGPLPICFFVCDLFTFGQNFTAQCPRCQIGYFCGKNLPCSNCRIAKINIFLVCLDLNTLRQIFLEIAWQNWPFKIGLSLLEFKHLLVDSGSIVQWGLRVSLVSWGRK